MNDAALEQKFRRSPSRPLVDFGGSRVFSARLLLLAIGSIAMVASASSRSLADELDLASALAEAGDPAGFYRLGRLYETGREVEKDHFEALRYYEEAANRGHLEAQFSAALIMLGALPGSPHSPNRAFHWFSQAAAKGHSMAAYFMAMSYRAGEGVSPDDQKAFEWYRRSAQHGNGRAMHGLAQMYASGEGVQLDLARAFAWNRVSATRGYEDWKDFDAELLAKMNEADIENGDRFAKSLIAKYGDPTVAEPRP